MPDGEAIDAVDRGERALDESAALVECLREACDAGARLSTPRIATILGMVSERMTSAQLAFTQLRAR